MPEGRRGKRRHEAHRGERSKSDDPAPAARRRGRPSSNRPPSDLRHILSPSDAELAFLLAVTVFSAPQNVTLEELRIESYFPIDDATARACEDLADRPAIVRRAPQR